MKFFDRVRVATTTLGQGTLSFGAATSPNMLTPLEAGALEGDETTYVIEEGADFEIGRGVIGSGSATMTRATVLRSKIGGVAGTAKMSLAGNAKVRFVQSSDDINDVITSLAGADAALAKRLRFDAPQGLTPAEQGQARANISSPLRGHIFGLQLSNSISDAANDIDIAAGEAASTEANPVLIVLASGITKRLDALWAVGTNQGGLDVGAVANTTYHVWLIQRSDTGVVDVLFSTSATSPTMPTNYDRKRRIGSIIREDNAIVGFVQSGDLFMRKAPKVDRTSSAAFGPSPLTLSVPVGIPVRPVLSSTLYVPPGANVINSIGDANAGGATILIQQIAPTAGNENDVTLADGLVNTNTIGQIYFQCEIVGGSIVVNILRILGWHDSRGRQ